MMCDKTRKHKDWYHCSAEASPLCRYNSATGIFTVPTGGAGVYYFSSYIMVNGGKYGYFVLTLNGNIMCTMVGDHNNSGIGDMIQTGCSGMAELQDGEYLPQVWPQITVTVWNAK